MDGMTNWCFPPDDSEETYTGTRDSGSGDEGKTPTDGGKGNQQGGTRGNDQTDGNPNDGRKK